MNSELATELSAMTFPDERARVLVDSNDSILQDATLLGQRQADMRRRTQISEEAEDIPDHVMDAMVASISDGSSASALREQIRASLSGIGRTTNTADLVRMALRDAAHVQAAWRKLLDAVDALTPEQESCLRRCIQQARDGTGARRH